MSHKVPGSIRATSSCKSGMVGGDGEPGLRLTWKLAGQLPYVRNLPGPTDKRVSDLMGIF